MPSAILHPPSRHLCYLRFRVRVSLVLVPLLAVLLAGCQAAEQPDHQAEWRAVLSQKKVAVAPHASPQQKQVYADSLAAFTRKHPNHGRASEVYRSIQLEFADDLASLGRYRQAVRFYRAVLQKDPANERAAKGLAEAVDRLAVTREKLLKLEKGMSPRQVASILGRPIPGWTAKTKRREATIEAWYYGTTDGGVAAVFFRDGRVFAAEDHSHAKLARLGS